MDTPPGGAPCVCRWRKRAPDARGWWVHDCAQPYIQGHLTPVPAILREVGIPSMPRCPWLEIPIPSRPGPSIQRLRPTNSIGSAPGGLYIRTGVCGLRTPDRILSIISSTGSCYVTPGKHRLLQHFRVSPVSIAWHDPEAERSSPDSCEGGSEEKICPRIGQSVTAMGQDKAILILFVLSSQDVSLMSGIRPSFWTLSIMRGNNA